MAGDLRGTLLNLERQGWESLCNGTGADFYGTIMTDDAMMVLANGAVMDRNAVVDSLTQAPPWRTYSIQHARVIDTAPSCCVLVYIGTAYRDSDEPFVAAMSSVYVQRDDEWRLALYQQTPVSSSTD